MQERARGPVSTSGSDEIEPDAERSTDDPARSSPAPRHVSRAEKMEHKYKYNLLPLHHSPTMRMLCVQYAHWALC